MSMGLPQTVARFTPVEYYRLEHASETKSEFHHGEIFAMAGASIEHSQICTNLIFEIQSRLKGTPCVPLGSDTRLKVESTGLRVYPDVGIYCGPIEIDPEDPASQTATNPTVLFEVLSKSTESYDRGTKAQNYRQIKSLRAHILLSQNEPRAEIYERGVDGGWLLREVSGLESTLAIPSIDVTIPLADLYARVDFARAE